MYNIDSLIVSDSSLNGLNCWRKFELRKMYGHARNESDGSLATEAGHTLHSAWQTYMATAANQNQAVRETAENMGIWQLMQRFPAAMPYAMKDVRNMEACYSSFRAMLANPIGARYELATVTHNGTQLPAVEVPFRITIKDFSIFPDRHVPVYFDGFIDAIVWDTVLNRFVVVDIKTTRINRTDYTMKFKNDTQCIPYAFVLDKALNQPANALDVVYFVVYIDLMEPRATQYEFHKDSTDIGDWASDLAIKLNWIRQMAAMGFFPKNGKSCDTYGVCKYDAACSYKKPDAIRQQLDLSFGKIEDSNNSVLQNFDPWFVLDLEIEGLN